jgi:hypothetical protein
LKLFDEALPVGRSGAKCRMFCMDWGDASRIMALTMQKYVCFRMGAVRSWGERKSKKQEQNAGVLRSAQNDKQRRCHDNRSGMGRSTSVPDVGAGRQL